MDFGELNDNMIKGLMILFKISWAVIYLCINLWIDSCINESNKGGYIVECQAKCEDKLETSVHALINDGF